MQNVFTAVEATRRQCRKQSIHTVQSSESDWQLERDRIYHNKGNVNFLSTYAVPVQLINLLSFSLLRGRGRKVVGREPKMKVLPSFAAKVVFSDSLQQSDLTVCLLNSVFCVSDLSPRYRLLNRRDSRRPNFVTSSVSALNENSLALLAVYNSFLLILQCFPRAEWQSAQWFVRTQFLAMSGK